MFPWKPVKLACCRKHIKRYNARGKSPGELLPCCLPECDELVLVPNRVDGQLWWCCRKHGNAHYKRIETGFYDRLRDPGYRCAGRNPNGRPCSERYCIDEHHTVFKNGTSHKKGPVITLCPTHHMALHRGLAIYDERGYRWIVRGILDGLRAKHPTL